MTRLLALLLLLAQCSAFTSSMRPAVLRPTVRASVPPAMEVAAPEATASAERTLPAEDAAAQDAAADGATAAPRCAPVASTLELLEWEKLSAQVAGFAGTGHGRELLRGHGLPLPEAREESEQLLAETREAWTIEQRLAKPLDLRGFHELSQPVSLAEKGGVLDGEQLAKLASSLSTAAALSKQLKEVSAAAEAELTLLPGMLNAVPLQAELRRDLGAAIDEAGEVRDSASPTLGELRYAMRELAASTRKALGAIIAKKSDALATSQPVYRGERFVLQVVAERKHQPLPPPPPLPSPPPTMPPPAAATNTCRRWSPSRSTASRGRCAT